MAMDALKNLDENIPRWLKKLDDLSGQIDLRQAELAAAAAREGKGAEGKSLRNKGSTESLRPQDDGPSHSEAPAEATKSPANDPRPSQFPVTPKPSTPPNDPQRAHTPSPTRSPSASKHQTQDVKMVAQSRARAHLKKRQRSSSLVSADGPAPVYRTRSMIIVYYDSYVQIFFDDLVRFVSSSRNLMRKAKMAAKVAQIKRLAEMEVTNEDNTSGEDKTAMDGLPSLRYMSTRRFGPMSSISKSGQNDQPDVYDSLDKGLEFVQSMCEHGAHQFLRDGSCTEDIEKVQKRLVEVLETAKKEIERVQREEPELAKETGDMGKVRTRRPISMRRELSASLREGATPTKDEPTKLEATRLEQSKAGGAIEVSDKLEVDADLEADEGIEVEQELPKLQYRSTRNMGRRTG